MTHRTLAQFLTLHHAGRTGEGLLLRCTVSHDNHVVQHDRLILQDEINHSFAVDRTLTLRISQIGRSQHRIHRHLVQDIISVKIGDGSICGALHKNTRAHHRHSVLVNDTTGDRNLLLCKSRKTQQKGQHDDI